MRKTVLVTGSSSGIGKEIARILAKDYDIILHYNSNENSTRLLKKELDKEYNRDYLMVKCDLSKEDEIDNMLDIIYNRYNNIDILINNAGIAIDTLFEDKNAMKALFKRDFSYMPFVHGEYKKKNRNERIRLEKKFLKSKK